MNRKILVLMLAGALAACGQEQAGEQVSANDAPAENAAVEANPGVNKAVLVAQAKDAVKSLGGQLKGQLQSAIKQSGAVGAVEVCKDVAPQLARNVSAEQGVEIGRVSLKNRNPFLGVPKEWQTQVLNDFEARLQAGEAAAGLSYAEVVDEEFRFMKAIPTAAVCLKCHGSEIEPEVAAKIREFYPDDRATGFSEGDIRGAFVVTRALSK